ncbi:hypothetical protein MSAN_02282500 [Mycena sanguinolenta]|uniref:Uncharacterized protein n=1 Tax=Mycena sanguinolenta TaxID=230812 RepID=A0A8H7CGY7_9AGAR|nr:hypothetical protein MSAN_02282500 [Mycena sanguinolenta]
MDPQADSDEEFIVLSTSDYTESPSYAFAELFVKSIGFLPSLLGAKVTEFQSSGAAGTYTRKYSETMGRQIVDQRSVTNYYISGGRGGSGGEGGDKGGDGGPGHGPTVYFGQPETREPSDFRTIRRGDLKLLKEVRLSTESGVVSRQSRGADVRRTVYHAEIRGDPGIVTVAMYQGDGAEEEWRTDVATYESIWHPHVMQLYGFVNTTRLYAMVFHDELIPFDEFFSHFQHSSILTAYIKGYGLIIKTTEYREALNYISDVFRKPPSSINCDIWIQPSTGKFCLDLVLGGPETTIELRWPDIHILRLENLSLDAPDSENMIISTMSEDQYYELCSEPLEHVCQVSTKLPIGPAISRLDSQHRTCVRIMEPLQTLHESELHWNNYGKAPDELLPNSWIRYDSHRTNTLLLKLQLPFSAHGIAKAWLAQANCIFAELQELEHIEDYVCVSQAEFMLRIPYKHDIPQGYLFVCPPEDFRTGTKHHANLYQWPACPAYWSLDPSGVNCLSTEDVKNLGFPAIHIETVVGKGFNPDSREVARQLGYPLFEVLSDHVPFPAREVEDPWCDLDDPEFCWELGHFL